MGARPPPHGRSPTAPWALAHRPMGARPSPRGRSPTAPWALAKCPSEYKEVDDRKKNNSAQNFALINKMVLAILKLEGTKQTQEKNH